MPHRLTVKSALHRSENLIIQRVDGTGQVEVEIRFSHFAARGLCEGNCPHCGRRGLPSHWELEGPESRANTMWFTCSEPDTCDTEASGHRSWTQPVLFARGWEDR